MCINMIAVRLHINQLYFYLLPYIPNYICGMILFHPSLLLEHRSLTTVFQSLLSWAFFPAVSCPLYVCHEIPSPRISSASFFSFPCGFHVRACLVIVDAGFRSVWPIHPHRHLLISSPTFCWCVFSHKSVLLMVFGQRIWRNPLRQLLIKVCNFFLVVLVGLRVSAPYSSTYFTLELNRRIVVCSDNTLELQMFLSCINVPLALPILALTSASVPPCLSIILPRYMKVSISSISFPSSLADSICIYIYLTPHVKRWLPVHLSSPESVDGCGTTVLRHRQSPGLHVAYLVFTGFHFFSALCILHNPVDDQKEEKWGQQATLSNSRLHLEMLR